MNNYDDVVEQLQAEGLIVDQLEVTGKIVRTKVQGADQEKRGWYSLTEIFTRSGEPLIVGSFGVFYGNNGGGVRKIQLSKSVKLDADERKAIRARLAAERKRVDAEAARSAERAAMAARKAWAAATELADDAKPHGYIKAKGVTGNGTRMSHSGALLIPMYDTLMQIHGLQIIRTAGQASAAKAPTKQYWPKGVAKRGHFAWIGKDPVGVILVVEGYATGDSLNMATGHPVAVAFDAGNLAPVAEALRKRWPGKVILICGDDDRYQKCVACVAPVDVDEHSETCPSCDQPHKKMNAGRASASVAALAASNKGQSSWMLPDWAQVEDRWERFVTTGVKLSDFNDLHTVLGGQHGLRVVAAQVTAHLSALGYGATLEPVARLSTPEGGGKANLEPLRPLVSVDELLERFALVYAQDGQVFDFQEHKLMKLGDMRDACMRREIHRAWMESPDRKLVRKEDVGFDPTGKAGLQCNLWAGWPTEPVKGNCDKLLELLYHLCERNSEIYNWVLGWLAYPIQNPGAKMHTALVLHGGQGTGKNLFFETIMHIYGRYGRIIDQQSIESQFNDYLSARLFLLADEVVARQELYHVKNRLKAYITGDWLRINPKGAQPRDERNHANLVFLSNEDRPVALELDDRRHCVLHVSDPLEPAFYPMVAAEIEAGGGAALHHFLLHDVALDDFTQATKPPMTQAKRDLIEASQDSTSRFWGQLMRGEILDDEESPLKPILTQDLYRLYSIWGRRTGQKPAPMPALVNRICKQHRAVQVRERYIADGDKRNPTSIIMLGDSEPDIGQPRPVWLGTCIQVMRRRVSDYIGSVDEGGSHA